MPMCVTIWIAVVLGTDPNRSQDNPHNHFVDPPYGELEEDMCCTVVDASNVINACHEIERANGIVPIPNLMHCSQRD